MLTLTYPQLLILITALWLFVHIYCGFKSTPDFTRELQLLMVYICIIVIVRIVDFPWHLENGHIGALHFDTSKIFPLWVNLVPVVHLFETYDGWKLNLFGNIAMFVPVGIVWPVCFEKIDSIRRTVLAGALFSFCIEVSQLLFYERCSDIDDIILNTAGVAIGAAVYFAVHQAIKKLHRPNRQS